MGGVCIVTRSSALFRPPRQRHECHGRDGWVSVTAVLSILAIWFSTQYALGDMETMIAARFQRPQPLLLLAARPRDYRCDHLITEYYTGTNYRPVVDRQGVGNRPRHHRDPGSGDQPERPRCRRSSSARDHHRLSDCGHRRHRIRCHRNAGVGMVVASTLWSGHRQRGRPKWRASTTACVKRRICSTRWATPPRR